MYIDWNKRKYHFHLSGHSLVLKGDRFRHLVYVTNTDIASKHLQMKKGLHSSEKCSVNVITW